VSGFAFVGGLIGYGPQAQTTKSYSTGTVSGTRKVGGLAGVIGFIDNSYSTSAVTGLSDIGGLAGEAGSIRNSYSTGLVTGVAGGVAVGGLFGQSLAAVSNTYWNTETSGKANCAGSGSSLSCTGLTTAQMKQQARFSGWDFSTVWGVDEGASFPFLRANEQSPHPAGISGAPSGAIDLTGSNATAGINQTVMNLSTVSRILDQTPPTVLGTDPSTPPPSCGAGSIPFAACTP